MPEQTYKTTDFYTTAVLILKGFKIQQVDGERHKTFVFLDTEELQTTILAYMNGDLTGNCRDFRNAIENVKDLVHAQ